MHVYVCVLALLDRLRFAGSFGASTLNAKPDRAESDPEPRRKSWDPIRSTSSPPTRCVRSKIAQR